MTEFYHSYCVVCVLVLVDVLVIVVIVVFIAVAVGVDVLLLLLLSLTLYTYSTSRQVQMCQIRCKAVMLQIQGTQRTNACIQREGVSERERERDYRKVYGGTARTLVLTWALPLSSIALFDRFNRLTRLSMLFANASASDTNASFMLPVTPVVVMYVRIRGRV